jgi:hypothetical protein
MATLRLTGCRVETNSIAISFSEKVDPGTAGTIGNYAIFAPNSGFTNTPALPLTAAAWNASPFDDYTVYLSPKSQPSNDTFSPGDWVLVTVKNVQSFDLSCAITSDQISGQVPGGAARATRDAEDLFTYPQLTEDYRPSPVGPQVGSGGGISGGGSLGQIALQAVSDVLGWRPSADPKPKEFLGALTQSFNLTEVRGQVKSTWVQRSYAVQTDLGGRISGAQASLYTRAKDALDQSLSLLDGLYPLDPDADPEYVKALREMARSQMVEIVKEFGTVGLPSILRIDTYFQILLGQSSQQPVQFDPDKIAGTLGELRDTYGIYFRGNTFNNSVADEEDITNFRVISDYMTSLMQSWIANRDFFIVSPGRIAFFGTQLVLIGRQFGSVADTVNEVRFALDSVFIGRNERQSLLLRFRDHHLPAMFLEDMLVEIETFVTDEGPRLLRDGGKISVKNNILPVVKSYLHLVRQAHDPENKYKVPDGFRTARVRRTLDDLQDQLRELMQLVEQVEQELPPVTDKFQVASVNPPSRSRKSSVAHHYQAGKALVSIFGGGFNPQSVVTMRQGSYVLTITDPPEFYSDQRMDVTLDLSVVPVTQIGPYDVEVKNAADEYVVLSNGFTVTNT